MMEDYVKSSNLSGINQVTKIEIDKVCVTQSCDHPLRKQLPAKSDSPSVRFDVASPTVKCIPHEELSKRNLTVVPRVRQQVSP